MKIKKQTKLDIILIASLLLVSVIVLTVILATRKEGAYAVVSIDGKEVGRYSLSHDGEYTLNGGTNIISIKNGKVFMTYANCPDKTCIRCGKISHSGESITCLPNKITVYVEGGSTDGVELVS